MDENNPNNPRTPHSVSTVKSEVSLDLVFRFFTVCPVDDLCFMYFENICTMYLHIVIDQAKRLGMRFTYFDVILNMQEITKSFKFHVLAVKLRALTCVTN